MNYLNIDEKDIVIVDEEDSKHLVSLMRNDNKFHACKKERPLSIARKVGSSNARGLYLVADISCKDLAFESSPAPMSHWLSQERRNDNIHRHRRDFSAHASLSRISRYYEGDNYDPRPR